MIDFYKDPKGETIFSNSSAPNSVDKSHALSKNTTDSDTVDMLKKKVIELEAKLAKNQDVRVSVLCTCINEILCQCQL